MYTRSLLRFVAPLAALAFLSAASLAQQPPAQPPAQPVLLEKPSLIYKVQSPSERLEMTAHTSRIVTMDQKIPQAQVNNPDILELTPLSPNQIQVAAKAAGVTQINLWDENKKLFTIDVIVYGDVRELTMVLRSAFPNAALKVVPVANSVMISGFVDQPEHIDRIVRIAEEFYPKVINNMAVGGVQQVLLHVKVMEVSRTKLRQLGFDWAKITGNNIVVSSPTGLLSDNNPTSVTTLPNVFRTGTPSTFAFAVGDSASSLFYGVLEAMRQDNLMKIMSEPTLVTVSGRAASFNSGGEIPVPEPQSLGTISISWKKYGTQIDFVPIVLGNGRIRLEVRPRISELDSTQSVTVSGTTVPGIKAREADTGVELQAGQTLAIAGLVQTLIESQNSGLPWISEVPYLGAAFRQVKETKNEVELLILVTPELVEAMDACEVPPCGPGMQTTSPSDWELFMKGHLEVPNCCPNGGPRNGASPCPPPGAAPNGPPPDGMIGPNEAIPAPPSAAPRPPAPLPPTNPAVPQNRYNSSKVSPPAPPPAPESPGGPPGFIGPAGYDVVK
jgi:pilus assembly protein CpaC